MEVIQTVQDICNIISQWKKEGLRIGLVPTMGYLHEGHESLMNYAIKENDRVVVSIFVNRIQFGPNEDFDQYPRDFEQDKELCEKNGIDVIFCPKDEEIYPPDFCTFVDMTGITEGLCGQRRPGHFRGVCTIVNILFHLIQPNRSYFGQKDFQQLAVIKRMVRDLHMNIEIIGCLIIREADGLAKSSRNTYLNEKERIAARILRESLRVGEELLESGERKTEKIIASMTDSILEEPLATIDYIEIVDLVSMKKVEKVESPVLVAMAIFFGETRLIDNFIFQ